MDRHRAPIARDVIASKRFIESTGSDRTTVHGCQHLHLIKRIEATRQHVFSGHPQCHTTHQLGVTAFRHFDNLKVAIWHRLRSIALVDGVRLDSNLRARPLSPDLLKTCHWDSTRTDHIAKNVSRPNRGQLILITDDEQSAVVRQRHHQSQKQQHIDHRCFINDHYIRFDRVASIKLKAAGASAQETMNSRRRPPGCLRHSPRGTASWRTQRQLKASIIQCLRQHLSHRGFPHPRPTRKHSHPIRKAGLQCLALLITEHPAIRQLTINTGLVAAIPKHRTRQQRCGDGSLGFHQRRQAN